MSDELEQPTGAGAVVPVPPQPQPMRLDISTQGMSNTYTNFFRVAGTFEELLIDFGFHTGIVINNTPEAAKLTHRVVMNFATAKRLLTTLQASIARHEQTFGTIETDPQKRTRR